MSQSISDLVSPDVAAIIARSHMAVIPFGSVEQHGPHLPCGTDTMAAEVVSKELADRLDALYVPFGPYGVTPIHAGHPGTINLKRSTFEALLTDICEELIEMGVKRLVFCNWHEGNVASMDAVATEIQTRHPKVFVVTSHACYVAQRVYAAAGGELTHGGGIEVLAVMAHDPSLVQVERAGDSSRPNHAIAMDEMRRSHETRGYITDVGEIDQEGWYGNPGWASEEMAADFATTMADDIAKRVTEIFALREEQ